MNDIIFKKIGIIHTPYDTIEGMPIQPSGAIGVRGTIELLPDYTEALVDLDGFSHIILLYHFHKSLTFSLSVVPFLDDKAHGVFATRAPKRPNQIGLSIVELERVEDNIVHIINVDILDNTPLLDIKPYVKEFDYYEPSRSGWLERGSYSVNSRRSDERFK
ncbi:MAG: tRNA (N6-threonylcarbamoyladenosine(37)-N6)-methyltransferase TrmO [Deltaproteobacteria bacterium]|nr:tRNA (N6-threonylcarbamoyladenosine(37)-N6)-methyltransferase TrmO [Deltaproteobacteria bacterium]